MHLNISTKIVKQNNPPMGYVNHGKEFVCPFPVGSPQDGKRPDVALCVSGRPVGEPSCGLPPLSAESLLGNNREIEAPPPVSDEDKRKKNRGRRWARQEAYAETIGTKAARSCHRVVAPIAIPGGGVTAGKRVDVWETASGNFHYGGLQTCGAVWLCPICAAKISDHRRWELSGAIEEAVRQGLSVYHMTQTAPHHKGERFNDLLGKMTRARRLMMHRKVWKRIAGLIGLKGTVRGLENTYGKNGWHIHFHIIMFCEVAMSEESRRTVQGMISEAWADACESVGLERPTREHGIRLQDGTAAGDYVGKWGLEDELARSHLKDGRDKGKSPFQLLDGIIEGNVECKRLFLEYAKAIKGRRQLVWSKGLRNMLKMGEEKSDESIAEDAPDTEPSTLFAQIPVTDWNRVVKQGKRGELLEVCRNGKQALEDFLESLKTKRRNQYILVSRARSATPEHGFARRGWMIKN